MVVEDSIKKEILKEEDTKDESISADNGELEALDALEKEASEFNKVRIVSYLFTPWTDLDSHEKDAEIDRILKAFKLDAYGPRSGQCPPVPTDNTVPDTPYSTFSRVCPNQISKCAIAKSLS